MDKQFCQSCGMPLSDVNKGTNADGSQNNDFCIYCYKEGRFTQDFSMSWKSQTNLTPLAKKN